MNPIFKPDRDHKASLADCKACGYHGNSRKGSEVLALQHERRERRQRLSPQVKATRNSFRPQTPKAR
jgi:hypothetical protein